MSFHKRLQDIFDKDYPKLEFKEHMEGSTNYLDGVYNNDMSEPIMRLIDHHGRKGLAIKVTIREKYEELKNQNKINYEGCLTLSGLHKEYIKDGNYNNYLPKELSRHIESFLKEEIKINKYQYVIVFHQRYTDNYNRYVIAESWRGSKYHKWELIDLDSVLIIGSDGAWTSEHNKETLQLLMDGNHPNLLII